MSYPSDFDTKMFPETRYLALARAFAIWSAVLFLLIMGLGGVLWWTMNASKAEPVLIQISDNGTTWTATLGKESGRLEFPAYRVFQEAAVGNFARMWFTISSVNAENEALWCRCDRNSCDSEPSCLVCCASNESLFEEFKDIVNNDYRARAATGEEWSVVTDSINIEPRGEVSDRGGLWRLTANVKMGSGRVQRIEAFVRVARASEGRASTLGYYIMEFKAYPAGVAE
ncbi:MAG: hypothetical protein FWE50_04170 [Alphaproteobacteria bacterium]|nr:hypothetical protein [Alphaproteobacteria bacterium]